MEKIRAARISEAAPVVHLDWRLECRDPRLLALRDYWDGKRAGRAMPPRSCIRPEEIPHLLPHVILVDIEAEPFRLRYRLIGTGITETMGRNSTGRYYDELYGPELLENINASFRELIRRKIPLRTYGEAFYSDKNIYGYETINLPLSPDGARVDKVLGMIMFHVGPPA